MMLKMIQAFPIHQICVLLNAAFRKGRRVTRIKALVPIRIKTVISIVAFSKSASMMSLSPGCLSVYLSTEVLMCYIKNRESRMCAPWRHLLNRMVLVHCWEDHCHYNLAYANQYHVYWSLLLIFIQGKLPARHNLEISDLDVDNVEQAFLLVSI